MSACLSSGGGGAAAYSFELEKMKSPPSSSNTTRATSPSSTLSESSNSPLTISTRKPRTQRKRPNQTYNEAAALLSSAYPDLFSSNLSSKKKTQFSSKSQFYGIVKSPLLSDNDEDSDLLLPCESIEEQNFLFHPTVHTKSEFFSEQKEVNSNYGGGVGEIEKFDFSAEFDAESILDEEIEGIDSIMGAVVESNSNLGIYESKAPGSKRSSNRIRKQEQMMMMINSWNRSCNGFKVAGDLPLGLGLRSSLRENDDPNLWKFQTVDFEQISPRIKTETEIVTVDEEIKKPIGGDKSKKKKKKKNKITAATSITESKNSEDTTEETSQKRTGPMLKLNHDGIVDAWSDKTMPFPDEILGSETTDVNARSAQILFGESGLREASVLRYKEKRRNRLFSKTIRYEVRKFNAEQRPRMKGRFVKRPN